MNQQSNIESQNHTIQTPITRGETQHKAIVNGSDSRTKHTKQDLMKAIEAFGIKPGELLLMGVSMKAVGMVEGGTNTLLEALLEVIGPEGTLVSTAYIPSYPLPLAKEHAEIISHDRSPSYAGSFANAVVNHPRMIRSMHPIQKFAAIGALAEELCLKHTPNSGAYDVHYRMLQMGGKYLRIGEDKKYGMAIGSPHLAQNELGIVRNWIPNMGVNYIDENGDVKLFKINWSGGCGLGFPNFVPHYHEKGAVLASGRIGGAYSELTDMKMTLAIEIELLTKDPTYFFCKDPWCWDCRATWECSPKNLNYFLLRSVVPLLRQNKLKSIKKTLKRWLQK